MNILSNALDAIEETGGKRQKVEGDVGEAEGGQEDERMGRHRDDSTLRSPLSTPAITISTRSEADSVVVQITDNGSGILAENLAKIFDTFFTTKPAGVGTGLGLAISRQIVEEKHRGRLTCTSAVGVGTEFTIVLPVKQPLQPTAPAEHVTA